MRRILYQINCKNFNYVLTEKYFLLVYPSKEKNNDIYTYFDYFILSFRIIYFIFILFYLTSSLKC